jgi:hypothetical protein
MLSSNTSLTERNELSEIARCQNSLLNTKASELVFVQTVEQHLNLQISDNLSSPDFTTANGVVDVENLNN